MPDLIVLLLMLAVYIAYLIFGGYVHHRRKTKG